MLNETIAYPGAPEPPPERRVTVGEDVSIVSVAARGDHLQAGAAHLLVVVPEPAPQVVPEDVRHVVAGCGRQAVVTDHALELVAQLLLQPGISSIFKY